MFNFEFITGFCIGLVHEPLMAMVFEEGNDEPTPSDGYTISLYLGPLRFSYIRLL